MASEEEEERRPARKEEEGTPLLPPPGHRPSPAPSVGGQRRAHAGSPRQGQPPTPASSRGRSRARAGWPPTPDTGMRGPPLLPRSVARAVAMACAQRREWRRGRGRVSCAGRSSAAPRWSRGPAAGGGEGPGGRQRREGGGPDMWAPYIKSTSTSHANSLTSGTVIWTSREPISKFRDSDVYFGSLGTGMTPPAKFRGRRCILLF